MYYFSQNLSNSEIKNFFSRISHAIQNIPNEILFYLIPICIFSLYSLFLGKFNSVDLYNKMPLLDLYSRLPKGIYYSFTQKLGFPILFLILTINTLIIYFKYRTPEGKKLLKLFKWIGFFALVYILLLPLGGYRSYRPYILRYDTIIPITLSLMFIFAKTTIFILNNSQRKQKYWYIPLVIFVLFVFANADEPEFDKNSCERNAILQIANSKEKIVKIDDNCTVLSWIIIDNPQQSELNTKLLKIWKIIDEDKLYYQKSSVAQTQYSQ
jgi:hypothetical protein